MIAGGPTQTGTSKVTATVTIGTETVTQTVYVKVDVTYSITLYANTTSVVCGTSLATITATLEDETGTAVSGVNINFWTDNGGVAPASAGPTDANGQITTVFTPPGAPCTNGTAIVTGAYQDASSTISITYTTP